MTSSRGLRKVPSRGYLTGSRRRRLVVTQLLKMIMMTKMRLKLSVKMSSSHAPARRGE